MPELKRTFAAGKMEQDKDERVVGNGEYREALNIQVATSEDSDVGAAQNILGNVKVTEVAKAMNEGTAGLLQEHNGKNYHIAHVVDLESDKLYRFIHTPNNTEGVWMDRIIEYDTMAAYDTKWWDKERAVVIDIYKVQSTINYYSEICDASNKAIIKITKNLNQLRWGMKVSVPDMFGMHPDMTIEDIDYVTGEILLDHAWTAPNPVGAIPVTFYGDRNLNFAPNRFITGLNIIDGMIFWTDDYSEPKKINIERSKKGSVSSEMAQFEELQGRVSNPVHWSNGVPVSVDDFNMHTLLVLENQPQKDCLKDEIFCPPAGCTDPTADNYDPAAVLDDGTCGYFGCADPAALNTGYDCFNNLIVGIVIPDNKCCCEVAGCTDPHACNYDPDACFDDGSCLGNRGCMDAAANNFDPNADCDDGSCLYSYKCVPEGTYAVEQCDNPGDEVMEVAFNYNYTFGNGPQATGSWDEYWGGYTTISFSAQRSLSYNFFNNWDPGIVDGIFPAIPNQAATGVLSTTMIDDGSGNMLIANGSPIRLGRVTEATKEGTQTITSVNIMIPVFKNWWPNASFREKWFWKWDVGNPGAWTAANETDGICNYPISNPPTGLKQKTKIGKVTISNMWGKPDGTTPDNMGLTAWNNSDKLGTGEMWDAINAAWVPDDVGTTHPNPGNMGKYYFPDTSASSRYVDSNGVIFNNVGDWFGYTAQFGDCGGIPCPDGETWNDIVAYLRANGFDGTGPRIAQATPISNDGTPAGAYGMLRDDRMGNVANMGGVVGNPNYVGGVFPWEHINETFGNPLTPGFTGWPEIIGSEPYDEFLAKLTNNYKGWEFFTGGDVIQPPQVLWIEEACQCDNMYTTPTCVQDPLGQFTSLYDCECCVTCDCHDPSCLGL